MALRLRIVSEQRRQLGERSCIAFGEQGGTIGRAPGNDWVLPDRLRYVSAQHARVVFREGVYYLEDLSSNGTYVNDNTEPLAARGSHPLRSGDMLRFGEYEVVVIVDGEQTGDTLLGQRLEGKGTSCEPIDVLLEDEPAHAGYFGGAEVTQPDLGAALDVQSLLPDDLSASANFRPVNAFGQVVTPAPRAPRRSARERPAAALADMRSGLEAFCRGANLDPAALPAEADSRLLHLAGQLLREVMVGLKDLERTQQDIRSRFNIESATNPEDPRPSLARSGIEELLIAVLSQHENRRLDAVQWLRETVTGLKGHEDMSVEAMQTAFLDLLKRLDPADLESRFDRAARRRGKTVTPQQYWDLYRDFYRSLADMPPEQSLPLPFIEAFATAYRELQQKKPD